jgi:hypothetical protein
MIAEIIAAGSEMLTPYRQDINYPVATRPTMLGLRSQFCDLKPGGGVTRGSVLAAKPERMFSNKPLDQPLPSE